MSIALLDVNVLAALFDPAHRNHEDATSGSGTGGRDTPAEVAGRLRSFCSTSDHHFWEDSVSLTDETLFQASAIRGHQKITDAYLLGLAVRNHGRIATFDKSIPLKAVHGAAASHLVLLGG